LFTHPDVWKLIHSCDKGRLQKGCLQQAYRCMYSRRTGVCTAGVQVYVQQAYRCMYSRRTGVCTAGVQVYVQQAYGCMYSRRTGVCTTGTQMYVQQAYRCTYGRRTSKGTVYAFLRLSPPVHWLNFAFTYIETGLRYIHNKLSSGIGVQY